jgi:ABC-2 type transport system ATP-binding protein
MAVLLGGRRARRTRQGNELLAVFGLDTRRGDRGRTLSKGLRQRLMLCMALVGEPAILFLDEPTSGLDVASARLIRQTISRLNRERGLTVFLTTHNLDEANALCHRVAIIHGGRLAAIDTPQALRDTIEARRSVEVTFAEPLEGLPETEGPVSGMEPLAGGRGVRIFTPTPGRIAQDISIWAARRGLHMESIATREPSLEAVFLAITGPRAGTGEVRR